MQKRLTTLVVGLSAALACGVALASDNPLHAYQEKLAVFINELTVAGLFLLPMVAGLAIVVVAVGRAVSKAGGGNNLHDHDDRIKQILGYLIIGESALGIVAIVSFYFT